MDKIVIQGGKPLKGKIPIRGAKNAALPIMAASLLTGDTLTLANVPDLADIQSMKLLLSEFGCGMMEVSGGLALRARQVSDVTAPYDIVRKMRASILVLGPLLARIGKARVSLPGGCAIGTRPVDLHLKGLTALGAEIALRDGYIEAEAPVGGLRGAEIEFPVVSVGATENLLMAATLARGTTTLVNAAREPEIVDLARCLVAMGADIEGIGTARLTIHGKPHLGGAMHCIIPDRIETGTFMCAAAITGGEIEMIGADWNHLHAVASTLSEAGIAIAQTDSGVAVIGCDRPLALGDIVTEPYPGFPTDLQAQIMAVMAVAHGTSRITETIFENRFMHAPELARMGADISVQGGLAVVKGVPKLKGAPVMATDLRASSSLVIAGLAAEEETVVSRIYHLDRGYERIEARLAALGADIARVRDDDHGHARVAEREDEEMATGVVAA